MEHAIGNWIGRGAAVLALTALSASTARADLIMGNWRSGADAPFGAEGDSFVWHSTIDAYSVMGWPELDLNAYWLNVVMSGTITETSGGALVDDYGAEWSGHSHYAYTGDWVFELVDQTTGVSNAIEMGTFALNADWYFLNTPYAPQLYADLGGAFYAEPGEVFFPNGYGPVDFSGLQLSFDGFYDYDSTLLSFTLSAPNSELLANVAVVPEPATTALLGMGIGLIALRSRRHNAVRSTAA